MPSGKKGAEKTVENTARPTAVVTGASRGIGRAIAQALAGEGYDLVLACRESVGLLEQLAEELEQSSRVRCRALQADVGDPVQSARLFEGLTRLDVLVNNAGVSHIGLLSDMTPRQWRQLMAVNLDACFYTCRLAIPLMLRRHSGRIINISSVWGNVGASMEAAYSASKGGVNALTRALAKELAPSNIQVNALALGLIDTDMNRCLSQEELQELQREIPADRMGTPAEAAAMVLQLVRAPGYLTGQVITMDGGWC